MDFLIEVTVSGLTAFGLIGLFGKHNIFKYPFIYNSIIITVGKLASQQEINSKVIYPNATLLTIHLLLKYDPLILNKHKYKFFSIIFGIRKLFEGFYFWYDICCISFAFIFFNLKFIFRFWSYVKRMKELGDCDISFKSEIELQDCPICLDTVANISLPCGHYFDKQCLKRSIAINSNGVIFPCPICRKEYNTFNIECLRFMSENVTLEKIIREIQQ